MRPSVPSGWRGTGADSVFVGTRFCTNDGTLLGLQTAIPQRSQRSNWPGTRHGGISIDPIPLADLPLQIRIRREAYLRQNRVCLPLRDIRKRGSQPALHLKPCHGGASCAAAKSPKTLPRLTRRMLRATINLPRRTKHRVKGSTRGLRNWQLLGGIILAPPHLPQAVVLPKQKRGEPPRSSIDSHWLPL
jgi:hypothetical protein